MRIFWFPLSILAALLLVAAPVKAEELLASDRPIGDVIDHYIDARLKQDGVAAAPQADDATVIRRLTLDLVGRIPTTAETQAYIESKDPNKRSRLVDQLMASPGFVYYQAVAFDTMLMASNKGSVREYLTRALTEQRPWDQIFRDLLLADENNPQQKGTSDFIRSRLPDLDKLTTDISACFFGVNISCARCHDHPRVRDWKQDHFFGMKSFVARTFDNGGFLAERAYGTVKFKTTAGVERQANLMFLTGTVVEDRGDKEPSADEQKKEKERLETHKKNKTAPPRPSFSARAQLVELALQPGQRDYFARALVNRLWLRFYGQGLVMPVDQMHSKNPPSHPELLAWLARDAEEHGYDLRRLIRGLVLSRAYARSSRWDGKETPAPEVFAIAQVRPLTPVQLANALALATLDQASLPADRQSADFEKRLEALEAGTRGFADLFEQPNEDFQISVSEALLFSNGERIARELLQDGGQRLVGRLKQIGDTRMLIDTAVRTVLSRPPTEDEVKLLGDYLQKRGDRKVEACRQLVWALLSSAEFRFNY